VVLLIRVFVRGLCMFDLFNGRCDVVAGTRVDITRLSVSKHGIYKKEA
jgi:hypothetical protein